jgi:hypothetical protein
MTCHELALGSFNMVLSVQWLESLGLILWDFGSCTLAFVRNGHRILWTTAASPTSMTTLAAMSADVKDELLLPFQDRFAEPIGLPSTRQRRHIICLLPGIEAVAVWPYKYTHAQKAELERQCSELLCLWRHSPQCLSVLNTNIACEEARWFMALLH